VVWAYSLGWQQAGLGQYSSGCVWGSTRVWMWLQVWHSISAFPPVPGEAGLADWDSPVKLIFPALHIHFDFPGGGVECPGFPFPVNPGLDAPGEVGGEV
jgi:hypothetical protein